MIGENVTEVKIMEQAIHDAPDFMMPGRNYHHHAPPQPAGRTILVAKPG